MREPSPSEERALADVLESPEVAKDVAEVQAEGIFYITIALKNKISFVELLSPNFLIYRYFFQILECFLLIAIKCLHLAILEAFCMHLKMNFPLYKKCSDFIVNMLVAL